MGWYYSVRRYYGHIVDARKTGKNIVEKIRKEYKCDYIELYGNTILFYVYEKLINSDEGSYSSRGPDTTGTVFEDPRHPIYLKELEIPPPVLSEKDWIGLNEIKKECVIEKELKWFEIANISY